MPIPQIPPLNQNADLEQVKNYVIRMERTLNFLLENGLDSENVFEIGGWRVGSDTLASKDGDVGMTTAGSDPTSIRLWAGSTVPDSAPWRVTKAGKMYATGATLQTAAGYPKVIIDPEGNLFGAYQDANNYIQIIPLSGVTSSPQFLVHGTSGTVSIYQSGTSSYISSSGSPTANDLIITSTKDITFVPGFTGTVTVAFDRFNDLNTGTNLYQQLLGKASSGVSTGLSGFHNHGIPDGTQLMVNGGGFVTFVHADAHSHEQN